MSKFNVKIYNFYIDGVKDLVERAAQKLFGVGKIDDLCSDVINTSLSVFDVLFLTITFLKPL